MQIEMLRKISEKRKKTLW